MDFYLKKFLFFLAIPIFGVCVTAKEGHEQGAAGKLVLGSPERGEFTRGVWQLRVQFLLVSSSLSSFYFLSFFSFVAITWKCTIRPASCQPVEGDIWNPILWSVRVFTTGNRCDRDCAFSSLIWCSWNEMISLYHFAAVTTHASTFLCCTRCTRCTKHFLTLSG